ncbi:MULTISPECIES: STAS domain-containing protein [Thermomonosporaceae]|uniref:STAS domain-containing protein n=1 Tax=Thermomonosporaceae TaxID=2012 RepID=UPI00255AE5B5|nr:MULTISPECIES: STAS domain-containing protein [Thermomonosporaceae]MDL4774358.1 STAS domain-containing protein [Actinomadura xylanilytica]
MAILAQEHTVMNLDRARVEHSAAGGVVTFPAEVDLSNGETILAQTLDLLDSGVPTLIIDLGDCAFCDSTGPNLIFRAQARAGELGVPMWVVLPSRGIVRRVCDVAGLARRVAIAPDRHTALAALTGSSARLG